MLGAFNLNAAQSMEEACKRCTLGHEILRRICSSNEKIEGNTFDISGHTKTLCSMQAFNLHRNINEITEITDKCIVLIQTRYLVGICMLLLIGMKLDYVTPKIGTLQWLHTIDLSWSLKNTKNKTSVLESLSSIQSLRSLSLDNNNLLDISPIIKMPGLELLDLRSNNLVDILPITNMPRLESLELLNNPIKRVTDLFINENGLNTDSNKKKETARIVRLYSFIELAKKIHEAVVGKTDEESIDILKTQFPDSRIKAYAKSGLTYDCIHKKMIPMSQATQKVQILVDHNRQRLTKKSMSETFRKEIIWEVMSTCFLPSGPQNQM
jgi:hypothetical protein